MAVLEGNLPASIEEALQFEFMWVSIEALEEPIRLYEDKLTYTGLMYEIADKLSNMQIPAKVVLPPLPPKEFPSWQFTGEYRPGQDDVVEVIYEERFGGVEAPPGFGKTVCMAGLTTKFGFPTAILVENAEPFGQAIEALQQFTNITAIGQVGGRKKARLGDVTVCMVQSLANALTNDPKGEIARWFKRCRVVICDEYHHGAADRYLKVIQSLVDPYAVVGVSATPEDREDGKQAFVDAFFGKPRIRITYEEGINEGYLCPITVFMKVMPVKDFGYVRSKTGHSAARMKFYSNKQKSTAFEDVKTQYITYHDFRNEEALAFGADMVEAGKSVAYIVERIKHAEELKRLNPNIVILDAATKDRKGIIEKLKRKEIMEVATTLFNEATNVPSLDCVALMAGGKGARLLKQRLRNTRAFKGMTALGFVHKKRGYVWYPMDRADYLTAHSMKIEKLLKSIVKEHRLNEVEVMV